MKIEDLTRQQLEMQEQQEDYVVHMQQASKNHLQELRDHFEREVLPDLKTRLERRSEHL